MKTIRIISLFLWVVGIVVWFTMPWLSSHNIFGDGGSLTAFEIATDPSLSDLDLVTDGDTWDQMTFLVFGAPCYFSALVLLLGLIEILVRNHSISTTNTVIGSLMLFGFVSLIGYFPEAMPFLSQFFSVSTPAPILIGCIFVVQFVLALIMKRIEPKATITMPKTVTPPPPSNPDFQTPVNVVSQPTEPYAPILYQEVPVTNAQTDDYWICGNCKTKNLNLRTDCWSCGNKK